MTTKADNTSQHAGSGRRHSATLICLAGLLTLGGCTRGADARAVATQFVATADTLQSYYVTLRTLTVQTDELNAIEAAVEQTPYTAADQQRLYNREAELDKRIALASQLSTLAQSFAALDGSAASVDVAADHLEAEIHAMTPLVPNSREQAVIDPELQSALHALFGAIQRGKEREEAQKMDDVIAALERFFISEEHAYTAIQTTHSKIAGDVAIVLVRGGQVDSTASLAPALSPFGLMPNRLRMQAQGQGVSQASLKPLLIQQIQLRQAAMNHASTLATADMQSALDELSRRVHRLAKGEPMRLRLSPPTLKQVAEWVAGVDQLATLANAPPAS